MKAEDQSLLIQEAQGLQTVQCLFIQPGKVQREQIGNVKFERGPDGRFAYVYNGTFDGFKAFEQIMEQHGVLPAHKVEDFKVAGEDVEIVEEPVVKTDPGKTETDTISNPATLIEGDENDALLGSKPADDRQPTPPEGGEAGAKHLGDNPDGSGHVQPAGGDTGGAAKAGNSTGPVSAEVKTPEVKAPAKADAAKAAAAKAAAKTATAKASAPAVDQFEL